MPGHLDQVVLGELGAEGSRVEGLEVLVGRLLPLAVLGILVVVLPVVGT